MSNTYYLAVDIGASSGRHILGHLEDGKMVLEEIYRFDNGMKPKNGHLCWDADGLFGEIKAGMKRCKELGKIPVSMGVDTWAVDYVLLDKNGERLGDAVGYRDKRTEGMDDKVYEIISPEELYGRTGIQKQIFNTIYQLMAVAGADGAGGPAFDASGLFSLSADRRGKNRVYQCHLGPACKSEDKGLGL